MRKYEDAPIHSQQNVVTRIDHLYLKNFDFYF